MGVPEQGGRESDLSRPTRARVRLCRGHNGRWHCRYVPNRGLRVGRHRQTQASRRSRRRNEGIGAAAFAYMQAHKEELSIGRDLDNSDFHLEVIDLLANRVEAEIGLGFFAAVMSALRQSPLVPAPWSSAT